MSPKSVKKSELKKSKPYSSKKGVSQKPEFKVAGKKVVARTYKVSPSKKVKYKMPSGYEANNSGLIVPVGVSKPVPVNNLKKGFNSAKKEINSFIDDITSTFTESYIINEIELSASFNADGKFMGFGVGGAATITIRIKPQDD
ncbi:MAG: hypothetical protein KDC52_17575 [Ignavibacteriae bacterium]|nr:hypothetical protein [Ignavibacteriota bacterium]MCB0753285.1 hypothetical protein [Ignavibacteriota bacterium]MCB9250192.1 hypothetical protein [Ignavibacteriales bacterium]